MPSGNLGLKYLVDLSKLITIMGVNMSIFLKVFFVFLPLNFSYANTMISSSCQFEISKDLCVNFDFKNGISRKTDSEFEIQITDKKGQNKKVEELNIVLWMIMKNGHEHGSDTVKIKENGKKFSVSNVWFLMVGEWLLKIDFKHQGKPYKTNIPVCVSKNKAVSNVGKCK